MQRIVLAIGQSKIDEAIARIPDVNVIGSVRIREHVIQAVAKTQPDLLIYAEILKTETGIDSTELLVKIKNDYPQEAHALFRLWVDYLRNKGEAIVFQTHYEDDKTRVD